MGLAVVTVLTFNVPWHIGYNNYPGESHAGLVTGNGAVYMWGTNEHGELGIGKFLDKEGISFLLIRTIVPSASSSFTELWF